MGLVLKARVKLGKGGGIKSGVLFALGDLPLTAEAVHKAARIIARQR